MFGKGISKVGSLLDMAFEFNIIEKSGAWFAYNGEKIGQGKTNVCNYLIEHPDVSNEIEAKIREIYKNKQDYNEVADIGAESSETPYEESFEQNPDLQVVEIPEDL